MLEIIKNKRLIKTSLGFILAVCWWCSVFLNIEWFLYVRAVHAEPNYFTDNIGIGTTSPAQKLHVEGQCVTGDSLLAIVRSWKLETGSSKLATSSLQLPASIEYIPITDVKPGDYALSLNEKTGQIEARKIKLLLDMGVKPVFELITETGRKIETTGNHPYLVKERGITDAKREQIFVRRLEGLAGEHGLHARDISEKSEFSEPRTVWFSTPVDKQTKAGVGHSSSVIGHQNEKLLLEEGKENCSNSSNLAYPKDEHPTDNSGFNLRKSFFKTFLGNFHDSFLSPVLYFIENFHKGFSAFVSKPLSQNSWYSDYSHFNLLSCLKDSIHNFVCQVKKVLDTVKYFADFKMVQGYSK